MGSAKTPKAQDGSDQADSQWPDPTPKARCGHWLAKAVGEGFNVTPGAVADTDTAAMGVIVCVITDLGGCAGGYR